MLDEISRSDKIYDLGGREIVSLCRCGLSKKIPFAMALATIILSMEQ